MKTDCKGKKLTCYMTDYVVFDLETTGINIQRDRIIEISAVKVIGHEKVEEYSTLVNPGCRIPPGATAVNGITNAMVAKAPCLKEAMEGFLEFIGDHVLVGHNIHSFDMKFVYAAALRELGREVPNDYVDTLFLARRCLPRLSHHRLTDVSDYFGIATEGAHRALNDCIMNMKCYEELGKVYEKLLAQRAEKRKQTQAGADEGAGSAGQADADAGAGSAGQADADAGAGSAGQADAGRNAAGDAGPDGTGAGRDSGGADEQICPRCGEVLIKRKGKFGEFYGCSGFPMCRFTRNIR